MTNVLVKTCLACQGTWFREVTLHDFASWQEGGELEQISRMPMTILICLCGTPFRPPIGGVRGGRTPNHELWAFLNHFDSAERYQKSCHDLARYEKKVAPDLARRDRLEAVRRLAAALERKVGRLLAARDKRNKRGRHWCSPHRNMATKAKGRDWLALEAQKCGLTFDQARAIVDFIFAALTRSLKGGQSIHTPLGIFRIEERKPSHFRIRLGKLQKMNSQRKVVVFEPAWEKQGEDHV
jgi:nucleoid DNA-binding protein